MELPVHITEEEVRKVCKAPDIRDRTQRDKPGVTADEAGIILTDTDTAGLVTARQALISAEKTTLD